MPSLQEPTQPRRAQQRYSSVAIVLHWAVAALIVWNLATVLLLPPDLSRRLLDTHKAVGITVLVLSLLRLGWRMTHPWPPLSNHLAAWEKLLARATHGLFYVLIILVPLAGWLMVSAATGKPVNWFGVFEIPALPVARSAATAVYYHDLHEYAAFLTLGLLALHVGGALKHSLFGRAPGLSRMWFGRRSVDG